MTADPMTRQCTATAKSTGWRCTHRPMRGQRVCRHHGGSAPQAKAAVERRDERDEAERAVQTYGLPRDIAPDEALLEEVHRTAGPACEGCHPAEVALHRVEIDHECGRVDRS